MGALDYEGLSSSSTAFHCACFDSWSSQRYKEMKRWEQMNVNKRKQEALIHIAQL